MTTNNYQIADRAKWICDDEVIFDSVWIYHIGAWR